MRRAIWMALAFMGTAPLMALAQQQPGGAQAPATQAPAGSPSGTAGVQQGQDTAGVQAPGAPGQQAAGTVGTTQGEPAPGTGGAGVQGGGRLEGTPLQRPDAQGGQGLMGGTGTGGTGGTAGPTYRGTTETTPPASPPREVGTQAAAQQPSAPVSNDAMQRELTALRQRVARLERQVEDLTRGTGGAGTGGGGTTGTANIRVEEPIAVASVTIDGTVRDITPKRIVIVDSSDGSIYSSVIDNQTRVFEGQDLDRINPRQLAEGTPVRASLELISGVEHARNIIALEPEQQQQQPRQRQGQPQGQPGQQPPSPQPQIDLPRRGGGMR
jgi:hypothetical protein